MQTYPPGHPVSVVVIPDDYQRYNINDFCVTPMYQNYLDCMMISNGLIKDRIEKVASEILEYYESLNVQHITIICVLKGGFKFCTDLCEAMSLNIRARHTPIPIKMNFVKIRSYVNDASGDKITLTGLDDPQDYVGKDILIVEDIIDTGRTMKNLHEYLNKFNVKSVTEVCLLVKRTPKSNGYRPRFAGFEIPDQFIVGYALDYNDYFRDLHHICVINEAGKKYFDAIENGVESQDNQKNAEQKTA